MASEASYSGSDSSNTEGTKRTNKNQCGICNQSFSSVACLKRHEKKHESSVEGNNHKDQVQKCYKCQICDAKFYSDREYIDHILEEHSGKDKDSVVCTDCGNQFKTAAQLKSHNESKCGTEKLFSCSICNSRFITQNTLNAHKLIHTGEKKHLCNFCGNRFLSKGQLKVHERSHTNDKPFKCDVCDKAFSYRESLVTHSTVHTGVKPYFCESCGSRFSCIGNLIKHRKARPDTCGLPQFSKNSKIAPRASIKNRGSLTMKINPSKTKVDVQEPPPVTINQEFNDGINTFIPEIAIKESSSPVEELATYIINDTPSVTKIENNFTTYSEPFNSDGIYETYHIYDSATNNYQPYENGENFQSFTETTVASEYIKTDDTHIIQFEVLDTNENDEEDDNDHHDYNDNVDDNNHNDEDSNDEEDDVPLSTIKTEISLSKNSKTTKSKTRTKPKRRSTRKTTIKNVSDESNDYFPPQVDDAEKLRKEVDQYARVLTDDCIECKSCPKQYTKIQYMVKHLSQEHNIIIEMALESKRERRTARKSVAEYRCNLCPKIYITFAMLKKHKKVHGPDGSLIHKCACCPIFFQTKEEVEKHQNEVHADRLVCETCKKPFKDPENLVAHCRYAHKGIQQSKKKYSFICGKCGKNFTSKVALSDHERSNCGETPIYKCDECGKYYHSAGSLKTHQSIHKGLMPHLCNYCGKAFRTVGQVKVHERSHNGIKPYKCEYCEKTFAHRETLLTHISLHTGFKRFMCSACGTRFSCISNLQAHRRSHKNTCGLQPNITKSIGPMGIQEMSNVAKMMVETNEIEHP